MLYICMLFLQRYSWALGRLESESQRQLAARLDAAVAILQECLSRVRGFPSILGFLLGVITIFWGPYDKGPTI